VEVKQEDIKEVEVKAVRYIWVCPLCGKTISSYTRAMALKYAQLHLKLKHSTSTP
jgi:hypothetical protein